MPRPIIDDGARPSLRQAIRLAKLARRIPTEDDAPRRRAIKPPIPGQMSLDDLAEEAEQEGEE